SDLKPQANWFRSPSPGAADIQPRDGALDLVIKSPNSEVAAPLRMQPPARYAIEIVAAIRPGSRSLNMQVEAVSVGNGRYTWVLDVDREMLVLQRQSAGQVLNNVTGFYP